MATEGSADYPFAEMFLNGPSQVTDSYDSAAGEIGRDKLCFDSTLLIYNFMYFSLQCEFTR